MSKRLAQKLAVTAEQILQEAASGPNRPQAVSVLLSSALATSSRSQPIF